MRDTGDGNDGELACSFLLAAAAPIGDSALFNFNVAGRLAIVCNNLSFK